MGCRQRTDHGGAGEGEISLKPDNSGYRNVRAPWILGGLLLSIGACAQSVPSDTGVFDWEQRWNHYLDRTFGLKPVGAIALQSALEQSMELRKCGRPPYCFPHHIGGSLVRRTARTTIELGAGALLKEDLRRRPTGLTSFRERLLFAVTHAALARTDGGEWRPAYSRFIGTLGAVTVSSAWHGRPITTGRLASSFGWSALDYVQDAVLTEFEPDLRRFGRRTLLHVRNFGAAAQSGFRR